MTLEFRAATAADVAAVRALVETSYRGEASRAGWTTEADLLDGQRTDPVQLAELLAANGSEIVLAEHDQQLLACAHLARGEGDAWFGMFAVRPTLQRAGIGAALLAECERIARQRWRCEALRMRVIWIRTELIDWYLRRGYAVTAETQPFPYGDARFGLPKRDDLYFITLAKSLLEPV